MRDHLGLALVVAAVGIGVFWTAPVTGAAFALVFGCLISALGIWLIWQALS